MKKNENERSKMAAGRPATDQPHFTREKQRASAHAPRRRRKKKTVSSGVVSALVRISVFLVFIIVFHF